MPLNLRMVDNGFDGLMQVGQRIPDVLITDLVMPGMDGFEMIRRLRQNSDLAHMDILVVSALDKEDVLSREDFPNNITVFGKPIPFHEIKGFLLGRLAARERRSA
jgi:CheY-like chemotaxis protein